MAAQKQQPLENRQRIRQHCNRDDHSWCICSCRVRVGISLTRAGDSVKFGDRGRFAAGLALEENERWYLAHALPNCERRAELHLVAQGFRTYFPTIQKTIRHARKLRDVRAPLFPRYVFIILDLGRDRWLSVRGTVGVSSLFCCENRPVPVPQGVVEALIANADEANLTLFHQGLKLGQSVRILSGPFANLVGTLERLDGAGRVRVLLEVMGTIVPVTIRRAAICPAA